jgi:hypothetical protein
MSRGLASADGEPLPIQRRVSESAGIGRRALDGLGTLLSRKPTAYVLLGLLAAGTVLTRIHSLNLPLWLDESWVANSVLEPTFREMMYYRTRLQTVPPLFLLSARYAVRALGTSNETFRLVPLIYGFLSFPLMVFAARRLLRSFFSFVAIALFVFSPEIVHYTHEFKQFSSDVFVSLALVSVGLVYLHRPARRLLYTWLALYGILVFLSYQAVLFIPGFCLAVWCSGSSTPGGVGAPRARWLDAATVAVCGAVPALIAYVAFIRPNTLPRLYISFNNPFLGHGAWEFLAFYFRKVLFLASLLLPEEGVGRIDLPAQVVILGTVLVGVHALRRRGLGNAQIFLCSPILCAYALDALGRYPGVGIPRLMLFSVPILILLFAYGLETLAGWAVAGTTRVPRTSAGQTVDPLGAVCLVLLLALIGVYAAKRPVPLVRQDILEDTESPVRYVSERDHPDDVIYVHAGFVEQFRLYSRLMPPRSRRVVLGRVGWGCCPRVPWLEGTQDEITMPEEVARLEIPTITGSIWLMYEDGPGLWDWFERQFGRRDPEVFARALTVAGCRQRPTQAFTWIRVDRYECGREGERPK